MGRGRVGRLTQAGLVRAAAALPSGVLAVATLTWLALAPFGAHPFWPIQPLTLSEAAALRDAGEVARLLADGVDPNARYPIRAGFLASNAVVMTPVEAAQMADRPEIVKILIYAGATPPSMSAAHASR
jgi:hypothetical protein